MSIQEEILRIKNNVAASYEAAESMGADIPDATNSDNLPKTILAIPTVEVVQESGDNTKNVMSQKATTDSINREVTDHNISENSHNDIRLLITELKNRLNAIADSEDINLDQLSEIVAYIKSNKTLIEAVTTNKVSVSDIIDNLTTNVSNKPLSAAQGVVLKALVDALGTNKLDASKLTEAINTALAQAKASGEFDGKDGDKGDNGYTPIVGDNGNWFINGIDTGITAWGTVITYTEINEDGHLIIHYTDGSFTDVGEVINYYILPYGGSKEWLNNNGDKSQLYQIGGYVWGYVESNGWTRSDTQFLVVSSESQMTNEGGIPYLLRNGDEGTVYGYTEASGDFDTPVYDSLPETANDGDIVAVGSKKYKASVGTKEVPAYTNLFDYDTMTTDDNLNQRVGSSGVSAQDGYWSALGIPVSVKAGDTVTIRTKGAVKQTTAYSYSRIMLYDENKSRSTSTPTSTMGSTTAKWTISDEGDGVYSYSKVIEDDNVELQVGFYIGSGKITANDVKDLIITFNEEIKTKAETTVTWENIGTYTPPVEAGWSATAESYSVIDSLSATAASGTSSVFSGDGYIYTYVSGSAWMQMSKYDKPSLAVDKELSDTSANAVQNKVIKTALDEIERKADKNEGDITALNEQVANLAVGSNTVTIPSVWQSAVDECISKIKALQVGRNCLTFPFFSDNHQRNGYAGILIAHIMKECNIPYCFYGGDSISSGRATTASTEAEMISQDKAFDTAMSYIPNGRFCRAVGNHDGYLLPKENGGDGITVRYTRDKVYDLFLREESIAQNKHFGGDGTYYYVDDIASKVRWIVLNTNGLSMTAGQESIDSSQLSWLHNTALSFNESGWAVVFISHHPITNHYHANISNANEVILLISNYKNSSDSNKADIVGWFSGHIHRDRFYTGMSVNDTDDNVGDTIPFTQVTVTSDANLDYDYNFGNGVKPYLKRNMSGDTSHAIDFVTINKDTRTVTINRLGMYYDADENGNEIRVRSFGY